MARAARKPRFERHRFRQRAQRHAALIAATIECLKRYGHEGLSIRTISAQAGVSVGLINHHFPNKDELVAAAFRHFNASWSAASGGGGARGRRPAARACAPFSKPPSLRRISTPTCSRYGWCSGGCTGIRARSSACSARPTAATCSCCTACSRTCSAEAAAPAAGARAAAPRWTLRLAAIGLTALLDGLWLEWCLEPGKFRPREAVALCEAWVARLCGGAPGRPGIPA